MQSLLQSLLLSYFQYLYKNKVKTEEKKKYEIGKIATEGINNQKIVYTITCNNFFHYTKNLYFFRENVFSWKLERS